MIARDPCLATALLIRFPGVTYDRCNDNEPANDRDRGQLKSLDNYCHYPLAIVPMKRCCDCDIGA